MLDIQEIAQRVRWLRQYLGLTQEQFAERAGLSYKFYQQIESGRKKHVWLETLDRIAAGFGLESWQLLAPTPPTALTPVSSDYPDPVGLASKWLVAEKPDNTSARKLRRQQAGRVRKKAR